MTETVFMSVVRAHNVLFCSKIRVETISFLKSLCCNARANIEQNLPMRVANQSHTSTVVTKA